MIFNDIFKKNRQAALKNRSKESLWLPTLKLNKPETQNIEIDVSENVRQPLSEDDTPQISKDELFDAQIVSDIFERDFRRYPCMFEADLGGTKI